MTIAARAHRVPMLLFVAISACFIVLLAACTPESKAEMTTYTGVNQIRAEYGLPPLTPDPGLLQVARARSGDMASLHYFSHSPPNGCDYVCLLNSYGVPYSWAGENIAWNTYDWSQTGGKRSADVAEQPAAHAEHPQLPLRAVRHGRRERQRRQGVLHDDLRGRAALLILPARR